MNQFFEQVIEQFSHPGSIFFLIAYALNLFMYHIKSRRRVLTLKFTSDGNYALYYLSMGATSGVLGSVIASLGGFIQAVTPDHLMSKTKYYRLGLAIILAAVSIYFGPHQLDEMLPLLGIISGRLAEMARTTQRVRIGMCLTFPLWTIYNMTHGFYLLVFANLTSLASLVWAIWKNYRIRLALEPI